MKSKLGALAISLVWLVTRGIAVHIAPSSPGIGPATEGGIAFLLWLVGSEPALVLFQLVVDFWTMVGIAYVCARFGGATAAWIGAAWWAAWPSPAVMAAIPFYYFWPAPFSIALVILWLQRGVGTGWSAPLLAAWAATRATALGIVPMIAMRARWRRGLAIVALVAAAQLTTGRSQVWHDLYVGIGTRPNPYGIIHKDEYAIAFAEARGVAFHSERYEATLRDEYLRIARSNPGLLARNWVNNSADAMVGWSFLGGRWLSWVPVLGVIAAWRKRDPVFTMVVAVWMTQCIGLGFVGRPQGCYLAETSGLFVVIGSVGMARCVRGES